MPAASADALKGLAALPSPMTVAIDIACPSCGSVTGVRKESLDTYRCAECGREFSPEDVTPE
ncbi:MAG: hypothetical protein ABEJ04_01520 [Halobacteriaceae archaeon]